MTGHPINLDTIDLVAGGPEYAKRHGGAPEALVQHEIDVRVDEAERLLAYDRHDPEHLRCAARLLDTAAGWAETRAPPGGTVPDPDLTEECTATECHETAANLNGTSACSRPSSGRSSRTS